MRLFAPLALLLATASALPGAAGEVVPISADNLQFLEGGDIVIAAGSVELLWRDWEIRADELVLDRIEHLVTATGHVQVVTADHAVVAAAMTYDTEADTFVFRDARGYFPGEGGENFHFTAAVYRGNSGRFVLERSRLTTCGPGCNREYEIKSRKALVVPRKKIEVWGSVMRFGGVPAAYFPYLYLDLKERRGMVNITVGENQTEGKFVKSSWYYTVNEQLVGGLIYDWTEDKGTTKGFTNDYWLGLLGGLGSLFFTTSDEPDTGRTNQIIRLTQRFARGAVTGNLAANRNRTFLPTSSTISGSGRRDDDNASLSLVWAPESGHRLDISSNYRINRTSFSESENRSANLNFNGPIGSLDFRSRSTWSFRKTKGKGTADQDLRYNASLKGEAEGLIRSWTLAINHTYDPEGDKVTTDDNRPFNWELPSLTLGLSPAIWDNAVGDALLVNRVGLSLARRQGPFPATDSVLDTRLDVSQQARVDVGFLGTFSPRNTFTQNVYDSGDALYVVQPAATLSTPLGEGWTSTFSHQYRSQHGRNPLAAGNTSPSNSLSYNLGYRSGSGTDLRISSGYDFRRSNLRDPSLSYARTPSLNSRVTVSWGWSLLKDEPRDLSLRYQLMRRGRLDWSLNSTFQMEDWRFGLRHLQSRLRANLPEGFDLGMAMSWRQNDRDPFVEEILLTKTNCCTFWQLSWRELDRQLLFTFGITAFRDQPLGLTHGNEGFLFTQIPGSSEIGGGVGGN